MHIHIYALGPSQKVLGASWHLHNSVSMRLPSPSRRTPNGIGRPWGPDRHRHRLGAHPPNPRCPARSGRRPTTSALIG